MHQSVTDKDFSLLNGSILIYTRAINNLYNFAVEKIKKDATDELLLALFYKQGQQFKNTDNKTYPAYSLKPALLAEIVYHLKNKSLNDPIIRQEIITKWRKQHEEDTGKATTTVKINLLLDKIIASKQLGIEKNYPLELTEAILFSFMQYKASSRQELMPYFNRLETLNVKIDRTLLLENDHFNDNDLASGKKLIKSIRNDRHKLEHLLLLSQDYEKLVLTIMLSGKNLKEVIKGHYNVVEGPLRPNCMETAFQNLANILIYKKHSDCFDFALLPRTLNINEKLKEFYEMQNYKIDKVTSKEVAMKFMALVAGIKDVEYRIKANKPNSGNPDYEIAAKPPAFLLVMNYLFGSRAQSLEELSTQFSDNKRKIVFKKIPHCDDISIAITPSSGITEMLRFKISHKHGELHTSVFSNYSKAHYELQSLASYFYDSHYFDQMLFILFNYIYPLGIYELNANFYIPYLISHNFAELEEYTIVKYLIKHEAKNPLFENYIHYFFHKNKELITKAIYNCDYEVILYSIKMTNNLNVVYSDGSTPLHYADTVELVEAAVKAGVDVNARIRRNEKTALHYAKNEKIAEALLKAGANPNLLDYKKQNPLHHQPSVPIVTVLLKYGANPDILDCDGMAPLHYASHIAVREGPRVEQSVLVIEALIKGGANPNISNSEGETPLHRAHSVPVVEALLKDGANPNAVDNLGKNPLHNTQFLPIIEALLKAGADPYQVDHKENTAIPQQVYYDYLNKTHSSVSNPYGFFSKENLIVMATIGTALGIGLGGSLIALS